MSPTGLRRLFCLSSATLLATLFLASGAALADGKGMAAAIAPSASDKVRASFSKFARSWVDRIEQRMKKAESSGAAPRRDVRDLSTELRSTGVPSAPYVGLLRYTEHVYSCPGKGTENCRVESAIPVTEIFRYEDGRWIY